MCWPDLFARGEFRDPELVGEQITVTEVRIGPDLKHATAFVARLGRSDVERAAAGAEARDAVPARQRGARAAAALRAGPVVPARHRAGIRDAGSTACCTRRRSSGIWRSRR